MAVDRRELLRLGVLALAGAACGQAPALDESPSSGCLDDPSGALTGARRIGEALLDGVLTEADAEALLEVVGPEALDAPAVLQDLARLHQADLLAERSLRLDGWLLSRTEARWYALVALEEIG